jgi:hypothetical protein
LVIPGTIKGISFLKHIIMDKTVKTILEFLYQETSIHFLVNSDTKNVMVNATEMAKLFNKRVDDFTRLLSTKDFIEVILEDLNSENNHADVRDYMENDIISSSKKRGTFMHEFLALEFAAWLNPKFKLWIYKTIRNILTKDVKPIKTAVDKLSEKQEALDKTIVEIQNSDNAQAKKLLLAYAEASEAQKNKTKVLKQFSKQISMDL